MRVFADVDDAPVGECGDGEVRDGAERAVEVERRAEDAARLGQDRLPASQLPCLVAGGLGGRALLALLDPGALQPLTESSDVQHKRHAHDQNGQAAPRIE